MIFSLLSPIGKVAAYATDFPTDAQLGVPGVIAIPHLGFTPEMATTARSWLPIVLAFSRPERGEVKNSRIKPELTPPAEFEKAKRSTKTARECAYKTSSRLGGNITSLNSAAKNGLGYLVCDTPKLDSAKS